jgi:hypothetical protein
MLLAEEVKKAKELARKTSKTGDDEPEWATNLSSWKDRRRKQSEETLMRVAEIKTVAGGNGEAAARKM